MIISRILVPTDFSGDADRALAYALELAQPFHASVHVLHVVENPLAAGVWSSEIYTAEIAGLQINLVRDAEHRLLQSLPKVAGTVVGVTREVRTGHAAASIIDVANERSIDLIVMGTRGRTGVPHLVMGSVADRVVRTAPCPVLTIARATRQSTRRAPNKKATHAA